ncbi:transposase [Arthrobacter sp. MW3 TE3886]|uniref:transposase n=1 Tax=Arthrobacter sp. MW3 TE3886 TaxID=3156254 RepID=UPI0035124726
MAEHVDRMAPGVLAIHGVGPVTDAIILAACSHHGRVRSEAAFAALAGASPIPASSATRAYIERRTGEVKSPQVIRQCLKRFIARQLFRQLQTLMA